MDLERDKISTYIAQIERLLYPIRENQKKAQEIVSRSSLEEMFFDLGKRNTLRAFVADIHKLQDLLGKLTHVLMSYLYQRSDLTVLDALNLADKQNLFTLSRDEWQVLRQTRNLFGHEYPLEEAELEQGVQNTIALTPKLLQSFEKVKAFAYQKIPSLDQEVETKLKNFKLSLERFKKTMRQRSRPFHRFSP